MGTQNICGPKQWLQNQNMELSVESCGHSATVVSLHWLALPCSCHVQARCPFVPSPQPCCTGIGRYLRLFQLSEIQHISLLVVGLLFCCLLLQVHANASMKGWAGSLLGTKVVFVLYWLDLPYTCILSWEKVAGGNLSILLLAKAICTGPYQGQSGWGLLHLACVLTAWIGLVVCFC